MSQSLEEIINDFRSMSDWEDRYKKIIQMGKEGGNLNEDQKSKDN